MIELTEQQKKEREQKKQKEVLKRKGELIKYMLKEGVYVEPVMQTDHKTIRASYVVIELSDELKKALETELKQIKELI